MTRYRTLVADPPWPGKWEAGERAGGNGKRYEGKVLAYDLMTVEAICALPVADLAEDDAHMYLWIPDRLLIEGVAQQVLSAWGFKPGRVIVWWAKRNPGLGRFPRAAHEAIVLGVRGSLAYSDEAANTASVQDWKQPYANGGKQHSAKPDGMLDLVERASPGPYLEMFARRARFGWDYWGDQSLETTTMGDAA